MATKTPTAKAAKASAAKKAPKKAAPPAQSGNGKATKEVLAPQLRILSLLASVKHPGSLGKAAIVEKAKIPPTWVAEYVGGTDNPASDTVRGCKKLVPAGLVKAWTDEESGGKLYQITAAGRKLVERLLKAARA